MLSLVTHKQSQMNIRIDEQLKQEGDAVFSSLGLSPSQAVRAFYEFAVRNRYSKNTVLELLDFNASCSSSIQSKETKAKIRSIEETRQLVLETWNLLGTTKEQVEKLYEQSDADLYTEALEERMTERGLL